MNRQQQTNKKQSPQRYYDGSGKTSKQISAILPRLLEQIGQRFATRPDLVLVAWPEVVGSRLASMTKATSFEDGVLFVRVSNSTLYSLLNQYDKSRIIQNLRQKFPNTVIKTVLFRLG
jgi:hypothetical protein